MPNIFPQFYTTDTLPRFLWQRPVYALKSHGNYDEAFTYHNEVCRKDTRTQLVSMTVRQW